MTLLRRYRRHFDFEKVSRFFLKLHRWGCNARAARTKRTCEKYFWIDRKFCIDARKKSI